jgi:alkanesulfonate monooxygenase SsuD/methylene tetrahydromethanopterin reductase-like flavin-dependent oxidoreductase (luciferase family)
MPQHGRHPDDLLIMPGITPFIGRTRQEARDQYDQMNALVDPLLGLSYLYGQMGDLSGYDVDGPVPEPTNPEVRSMAKNLLTLARRDNLTIRQLYTTIAAGFGTRVVVGTAADIVDDMQAWVEGGAADGFNICPPLLPLCLDQFAELVIPELRRRGMFRTEYGARTLRGNLGLREPPNRWG